MAIVHITGMESGVLDSGGKPHWTDISTAAGGSLSATGEAARTGQYGLRAALTSGGSTPVAYARRSAGGSATFSWSFWLRVSSTSVSFDVLQVEASGSDWPRLFWSSSLGVLRWVANGLTTDGPQVTAGSWVHIAVAYNAGTSPHTIRWWVNGAQQTNVNNSATAGSVSFVRFGSSNFNVDVNLDYDDFVFTNGDENITPHEVHGHTLDQTQAAQHQGITLTQWQWTDDWSSFTNFASQTETLSRSRLDDLSSADGVRINATGDVAGFARWPLTSPNAGDAVALECYSLCREAATGTNNATVRVSDGTTNLVLFTGNPAWGTTWTFISALATSWGGGAITKNVLDSLMFELDSTDASPNIWVAGYYGETAHKMRDIDAQANGSASVTATVTETAAIAGQANGAASVSATVTETAAVTGAVNGSASVTATVTETAAITGEANGSASVTASIVETAAITGEAHGAAYVTGAVDIEAGAPTPLGAQPILPILAR